jgi:cytochrome c peroxidase
MFLFLQSVRSCVRLPFGALTHHRRRAPQFLVAGAAVLSLALGSAGCSSGRAAETIVIAEGAPKTSRATSADSATEEISPRILRRFAALEPDTSPRSKTMVDLGRMLYYEPRLSKTGLVSCNSCHLLDRYGTTDTAVSIGIDGHHGKRNAPSTYHAAGHFTQFWDGRSPTIEAQAKGPLENTSEMGMTSGEAVSVLSDIDGYRVAFGAAFPGDGKPITLDHIAHAIGAFERGLVTPSRWDRYLAGDTTALTSPEKEGAKVFANVGCLVCHTGPLIGGSMFEKVGARAPWPTQGDRGRRDVTGNAADDMVFKVPSLRNVARTAPYFHDGSATSLKQAIQMMAQYQLGVELAPDELRDLEAWLGSLTGQIPTEYIAKPALPPGRLP